MGTTQFPPSKATRRCQPEEPSPVGIRLPSFNTLLQSLPQEFRGSLANFSLRDCLSSARDYISHRDYFSRHHLPLFKCLTGAVIIHQETRLPQEQNRTRLSATAQNSDEIQTGASSSASSHPVDQNHGRTYSSAAQTLDQNYSYLHQGSAHNNRQINCLPSHRDLDQSQHSGVPSSAAQAFEEGHTDHSAPSHQVSSQNSNQTDFFTFRQDLGQSHQSGVLSSSTHRLQDLGYSNDRTGSTSHQDQNYNYRIGSLTASHQDQVHNVDCTASLTSRRDIGQVHHGRTDSFSRDFDQHQQSHIDLPSAPLTSRLTRYSADKSLVAPFQPSAER